jgi:hypothetical protein
MYIFTFIRLLLAVGVCYQFYLCPKGITLNGIHCNRSLCKFDWKKNYLLLLILIEILKMKEFKTSSVYSFHEFKQICLIPSKRFSENYFYLVE